MKRKKKIVKGYIYSDWFSVLGTIRKNDRIHVPPIYKYPKGTYKYKKVEIIIKER